MTVPYVDMLKQQYVIVDMKKNPYNIEKYDSNTNDDNYHIEKDSNNGGNNNDNGIYQKKTRF